MLQRNTVNKTSLCNVLPLPHPLHRSYQKEKKLKESSILSQSELRFRLIKLDVV